jgi:hypothetical protein
LAIFCHGYILLLRKGNEHCLSRAIEQSADANFRRRRGHIGVKMGNDGGSAREAHEPEAPRQPLAKEKVVAVMKHRGREKLAFTGLRLPGEIDRKTFLARLARRVLHRAAIAAGLKLEAALRCGGGEAERDAASRGRRERR